MDFDDGEPEDVFAGREGDRVFAADGDIIRGRDRYSVAELNQYALEYRGEFLDNKMIATVGVRAPFFTRELNQYCYTPNGGNGSSGTIGPAGGVLCTSRSPLTTTPTATSRSRPHAGHAHAPEMPAVQFIPPYSEDSQVRRHPAERWA